MAGKTVVLTPDAEQVLAKMGTNIKNARLRRNISAEILAEKAKISKSTFSAIEKGTSTVSVGAYASVLYELGLVKDFERIAADEEGQKQFRESGLLRRERARRRENNVCGK